MSKINKYVVKISCFNEIGSGFICFPNHKDYVYVFTALHCLLGQNFESEIKKTDISICISDNSKNLEAKIEGSQIHTFLYDENAFGKENPENDVAIIVIPTTEIPSWLDLNYAPKLFRYDRKTELNGFISGFPDIRDNQNKFISKAILKKDDDNASQIQIEISETYLKEYDAETLVSGYSGSGVFIELNDNFFVCGVCSKFPLGIRTNRFACVNFSIINELLEKAELPSLEIREIETNPKILEANKALQANTKIILNRIQEKIGNINLERKTIKEEIKNRILSHKAVIISGKAGVGKSAITKNILLGLKENYEIITLKGEQLDCKSIQEVFNNINVLLPIEDLLNSKALKPQKIIFVDSIEKVVESKHRETILDFFTLLQNRTDVWLVLTCRTYDLEKLKMINLFSESNYYDVHFLNNEELEEISTNYEHIRNWLKKDSLRTILQIPFNLNLAVTQKEVAEEIVTEIDFKNLLWKYVIGGKDDSIHRKKVFSQIAIERAKKMVLYVKIENLDEMIVRSLVQDNIIERDANSDNRYVPTHDIYEDWALTRFIEDKYRDFQDGTISNLFESIGNEPAIRRGFRFWISEKLQEKEVRNLDDFLFNYLKNNSLEQYWKDEIIIAILQSAYSKYFLNRAKNLLFQDNYALFKRFALLLRVACQSKNFTDGHQYTFIPKGEAWANMIHFIFSHKQALGKENFSEVAFTLLKWEKKLQNKQTLPPEAQEVGLILLYYFELCKEEYSSHDQNNTIERCITLFLRLTEVVQGETQKLLETALQEKHTKKEESWRTNDFYQKILEYTLSWHYSDQLCRFLPNLVCQIAKKEWFYYPITEEEYREKYNIANPVIIGGYRSQNREEQFGVINDYTYKYFPSSAYQTPVLALIRNHYKIASSFIVKLFNHSIEILLQTQKPQSFSAKESIIEITYVVNDKKITQYGSPTLWCMYRGICVATPYLLQSVLMAFEFYLLELCRLIEDTPTSKEFQEELDEVIDYFLQESNTVSTTSVLLSVAMAYPKLLIDKILPILRVKEFYEWERIRRSHERQGMVFYSASPFAQEERQKANQLPHRKLWLDKFLLELSLQGFADRIFPILDTFYAENSDDENWLLNLNRMDLRHQKIGKQISDNKFLLETDFQEDLQPIAEQRLLELNEHSNFTKKLTWINDKYENKILNEPFSVWENYYQTYKCYSFTDMGLFDRPITFAVIGLRDYYNMLDEEQKNWCTKQLFDLITHKIELKQFSLEPSSFNPFDTKSALHSLVDLLNIDKEFAQEIKTAIFLYLTHSNNSHEITEFCKILNTKLWTKFPDFALALVVALIQYSQVTNLKYANIPHTFHYEQNDAIRKKLAFEYINKLEKLVTDLLSHQTKLSITDISLNTHNIWILYLAISIIPADTQNSDLQAFFKWFLENVLENSEPDDLRNQRWETISFDTIIKFSHNFALFLLQQEHKLALDHFKVLIDWIYQDNEHKKNQYRFIEMCLDNIISYVDRDNNLIPNFWVLWEHLLEKISQAKISYFSEMLLLSIEWKAEARAWNPIDSSKKEFFEKAILRVRSRELTVKLLSGIGFNVLVPQGIHWLRQIWDDSKQVRENLLFYSEKLIQNCYYHRPIWKELKQQKQYHEDFIFLLDQLISLDSTVAFLLREDFISTKTE